MYTIYHTIVSECIFFVCRMRPIVEPFKCRSHIHANVYVCIIFIITFGLTHKTALYERKKGVSIHYAYSFII